MNRQFGPVCAGLCAALLMACAQEMPDEETGLAVLAGAAEGYAQARPGRKLSFPKDHGPHPAFRIEWWYLTANLADPEGTPYGAQWTLFRFALAPPGEPRRTRNPWQSRQVYLAHMAITTPRDHHAFQRYARGGDHRGLAQAGVSADPFEARLDDWTLRSIGEAWLPLEVQARQGGFSIRVRLTAVGPLVLQGKEGFSAKHPDGAGSHYYSQPFLRAEGELVVDGQPIAVTGDAWLDREWSSRFLRREQEGWDWLALHLESGEKLMVFRLRSEPGAEAAHELLHAVLISPDGGKRVLDADKVALWELDREEVAGRRLPLHWRILLAQENRDIEVEALHADQWMDVDFPYWEGVVRARGQGPANSGHGYLELTGYPRK